MSEHLFSELALQVPPILTRRDVAQYFGRKVVYARNDFLDWLAARQN